MSRNRTPNPDVLMWIVLILGFSSFGGAIAASFAEQASIAIGVLKPLAGIFGGIALVLLLFRMYWNRY